MPVVEVEWVDSHTIGGWLTDAETLDAAILANGVFCRTVGYLYRDDEQQGVVVVQDVNGTGNLGQVTIVPKVAVRSVLVLREAPSA